MGELTDAINEGVAMGYASVLTEICDGRYEQDRCPLRPSDGCACYFEAYRKAPWWRRWRMEKPRCPDATISAAAIIKIRVETEMLDKTKDPIWRRAGKVT